MGIALSCPDGHTGSRAESCTSVSSQVHLLIDTTLSESKFSIQAFMSRLLTLGDKVLATEFVEMPCEVLFGEAERVGG
jgi:hypothetical protein